jgi:predicted transcriptional regulator
MPFEKGNKIGNRFKPGEVNNPNGRRNAARDILNKILDTEVDEKTKREKLLDKLVSMANRGNLNAIKEVLDRTEGKSTEYIITEEVKPIRVLEFDDDILDEKEGS